MLEAIFGIVGVIIGAFLKTGTDYLFLRRQEKQRRAELRHQYMLATLARRYETHQRAWSTIRALRFVAFQTRDNDEDRNELNEQMMEFQEWFEQNSLSFDPEVWESIYVVFEKLDEFTSDKKGRPFDEGHHPLTELREAVNSTLGLLQEAVALPKELKFKEPEHDGNPASTS